MNREAAGVLLALWGLSAGAQPLTLRARPDKRQTLAGESILIQIDQAVSSDLDMETVERNRNRTRIAIVPLANPSARRVFTGGDYAQLHGVEGIVQLGDAFRAPAGRKWTTELNLLDYTRPLAPGRYRIEISYRYGNQEKDTVRTNPVEIEVLAVHVESAAFRRFGFNSGEVLRGLWSATGPDGSRHWLYQESASNDPGVVSYAVDVGADLGAAAHLAQLNDIPAMQFTNYAVWTAGPRVCWLAVNREGRSGNPACADTGLAGGAALADPALQERQGGFRAVATGKTADGKSMASVVSVTADGKAVHRMIAIPEWPVSACVGWMGDGESPMLFYAAQGYIALVDLATNAVKRLGAASGEVQLAVDQWMGNGRYWAFAVGSNSLEARSWSLDGRPATGAEDLRTGALRGHPAVTTFGPESPDFALQFDHVLVTRVGARAVADSIPLALSGTPAGIFSIEGGTTGLIVTRVGDGAR